MKVINIYTDRIYKVYKVEVTSEGVYFLVYDTKDGWHLKPSDFFAPYDETTYPIG